MKEAAVHGAVAELADGSGVAIGKDTFGAEVGGDAAELRSDFVEGMVPGDALEGLGFAALSELPLGYAGPAAHRVKEAVGRVDAVEILGDLAAEEAARDGVGGISLNFDGATGELVDGDENAAGVRAVVRTDCVDHFELAGGRHGLHLSPPAAQSQRNGPMVG